MIKVKRQGAPNPLFAQMLADGELMRVELALIDRDENQPRQQKNVQAGIIEFAEEIKRDGLIHYPIFNIKHDGRFEIIVGERRTTAFRLLGEDTIPAICKRFTKDEKRKIWEIQYAENDQKNNKALTPLEDALWWKNYADIFWEGSMIRAAEAREVSKGFVSQKLKILQGSEKLKDFIDQNIKDSTLAYELVNLEAEDFDLAHAWIVDYEAGKIIGGARSSIKEMKRKQKAAESSLKNKKNHDSIATPVPTGSIKGNPLNTKALLARIKQSDFTSQFLSDAFLSVCKRTPFRQSLSNLTELDEEGINLFHQILELARYSSTELGDYADLERKIVLLRRG
jgi:ParB/RepB/Spo0J family partition protein